MAINKSGRPAKRTAITNRNQGMHNVRGYNSAQHMLDNHRFTNPRLYHLIFCDEMTGQFDQPKNAARFQAALKALTRRLTNKGIDYQWRACLELDTEKGLHFHVFMLVESKYRNPDSLVNSKTGGWLKLMLAKRFMKMHLAQPKADIHRKGGVKEGLQLNYATLTGAKLHDCKEWISYLYKVRSKSSSIKFTYFSSRARKASVADRQTPLLIESKAAAHELINRAKAISRECLELI